MSLPDSKLSFDRLGLKAQRLLLPIDLAKCPPEAFPLADGFTKPFGAEIILVYVLDQRRRADEKVRGGKNQHDAQRYLERIGRDYLRPTVDATARVRVGIPHEEILYVALTERVDFILLPLFAPSIWRNWLGPKRRETSLKLVSGAPCFVFVVDVQKRFNCFRRWAREESDVQCKV